MERESERKKEREDVHIWICSMGTFNGQKVRWGVILDLLVKGGQGGSKKRRLLCHIKQTAQRTGLYQ